MVSAMVANLTGVDKIVESNKIVAEVIAESNRGVAEQVVSATVDTTERLLERSNSVAEDLKLHNERTKEIEEKRFIQHRRLSYIAVGLSLATLLILIAFSIAFFRFAIIVRVGGIG